jgi:hypothetical protein
LFTRIGGGRWWILANVSDPGAKTFLTSPGVPAPGFFEAKTMPERCGGAYS